MTIARTLAARALGLFDPESAHRLALMALRAGLGGHDVSPADPILATRLAGMRLGNPVGLAAGFDKDAVAPAPLLRAGFGFVECGTTTPRPQPGNARPRLFRLREDGAVINRMGFNNAGLEPFAIALAGPKPGVVGANIGANKESADRVADYIQGLQRLWGLADYFALNVSSPNTPGLRDLQRRGALDDMLGRVAETRLALEAAGRRHPVFLKVAPDLQDGDVENIVEAAVRHGLDGLIVANTTLARPRTLRGRAKGESGGLSGAPLMAPSTTLLRLFFDAAAGRLALVGVGGVASGQDAYAKIRAGADAVQLYTALAYQGPGLVRVIKRDLAARLRADGFASVAGGGRRAVTGWRLASRFGGVAALAILIAVVAASGWERLLAPTHLRAHYGEITSWVRRDPAMALGLFTLICAIVTAACLPGIGAMIVLGGALFGAWLGGGASLLGIVIGSTFVFLACRAASAGWAPADGAGRIARMAAAFSRHSFSSLLVLRLTPIAPLSLVNIAAGLARMRAAPFLAASLIGSAPSNLIYAGLGAGLRGALNRGLAIEPATLTSPRLIWPLAALAALAAASAVVNLRRRR